MAKEKNNPEKNERKSKAGFLYLFAALARRASQQKGMTDLQELSRLIEAEIKELQNSKNAVRLSTIRRRPSQLSSME